MTLKILHAPHNLRYTCQRPQTHLWIFHLSVDSTRKHVKWLKHRNQRQHVSTSHNQCLKRLGTLSIERISKLRCCVSVFCNSIVINSPSIWAAFGETTFTTWKYHFCYQFMYNCSLGTNALLHLHLYIPISIYSCYFQ